MKGKKTRTSTERVRIHRQKQRREGYRRHTIVLEKQQTRQLNKLANYFGLSKSDTVAHAIERLWEDKQ